MILRQTRGTAARGEGRKDTFFAIDGAVASCCFFSKRTASIFIIDRASTHDSALSSVVDKANVTLG